MLERWLYSIWVLYSIMLTQKKTCDINKTNDFHMPYNSTTLLTVELISFVIELKKLSSYQAPLSAYSGKDKNFLPVSYLWTRNSSGETPGW